MVMDSDIISCSADAANDDTKDHQEDSQQETHDHNNNPKEVVNQLVEPQVTTADNLSDQQGIDEECERLLRNAKRQVKQMMEEAVTKKFIHEESSSIISLCVAIDACLSHGLKRRALGLFKTNSSTALIKKISKDCKSAQDIIDLVGGEEKRLQDEQQQHQQTNRKLSQQLNPNLTTNSNQHNQIKSIVANNKSQVHSNHLQVYKRNMWIKMALLDKKLVDIVEFLAVNSSKYYEADALMSNYLCSQILCSLLVGPCALEFSRSKTTDYYQFDDPSAEELMRRHKLSNPIACLCTRHSTQAPLMIANNQVDQIESTGEILSDENYIESNDKIPDEAQETESLDASRSQTKTRVTGPTARPQANSRSISPNGRILSRKESRRKPLALKSNVKTGTIVTDCHHYSCQDISEHQQVRGYSFRCLSSSSTNGTHCSLSSSTGATTCGQQTNTSHCASSGCQAACVNQSPDWSLWSPRMLHETLHQNSRSKLLYAKNNVILEAQPNESVAGYLSLHQTNSDLILKWIPNQMINGGHSSSPLHSTRPMNDVAKNKSKIKSDHQDTQSASNHYGQTTGDRKLIDQTQAAMESSYLDLVVNLSVSRLVLLQCQFGRYSRSQDQQNKASDDVAVEPVANDNLPSDLGSSFADTEETLVLVEADGVQRAPFRFPKGGLKWFLSCLESGLAPDKYLDPAIRPEDGSQDPLQSPSLAMSRPESPLSMGEQPSSRLDSILRRLPSLKRNKNPSKSTGDDSSNQDTKSMIIPNGTTTSCSDISTEIVPECPAVKTYIYRIFSVQQADWPLQTPPHSALSVGSSSSGSIGLSNPVTRQVSSGASGQKFRWTLGKLARFSTKCANSGSTSSSMSANNQTQMISSGTLDNTYSSICDNQLGDQVDIQRTSTISEHDDSFAGDSQLKDTSKRDNSSNLARIEAKLNDLKKSTSDDLLALRTQSLQTLCESMRKQIVARAFYGWLAYCRRAKIIREHLVQLIRQDSHLIDELESSSELKAKRIGLTESKWIDLMSHQDQTTEEELRILVNQLIYYGGIESDHLRQQVWPYILGHFQFKDSEDTKAKKNLAQREAYESCALEWTKIERIVKQRDREILAANMARASNSMAKELMDKIESKSETNHLGVDPFEGKCDLAENDNTMLNEDIETEVEPVSLEHDIGDLVDDDGDAEIVDLSESISTNEQESTVRSQRFKKSRESARLAAKRRRKRTARLESTGSVGSDASITDQFGNNVHRIDKDVQRCDRNFQYFKDISNLDKLRNIMCAYVWQHLDVGYVQGMCDLAAPFLVIFDDELMAYICFSQLMKRMVANFPHGSAMDKHFESLKYLMQILDPKLFDVLQSNGDYTHFYFCYRWLLLDFKRELAYEDVYKVWETIWSARHIVTEHFVVFMALAMVRYYRDIIIENNMDFTDTIKFFNEMAERHDADKIINLARDCIVELESLTRCA